MSSVRDVAEPRGQTPLMRQYYKIKAKHPQAILLFRMGDFYETFDEDARTVSRVLGITLTKRSNGQASDVALAGFPHHALENYLPKLVRSGHRVAICEQLEDPKTAKTIVRRDVVEVVSPGVSLHDELLNPRKSNFLACVHLQQDKTRGESAGVAFVDISTGEFSIAEVPSHRLADLLLTIGPSEVIVERKNRARLETIGGRGFVTTTREDWVFGHDFAYETMLRHFGTHSLKGFGVEEMGIGIVAAGAALHYLDESQKGRLPQVRRVTRYATDSFMALDPQTKRNLELVSSMHDGGHDGTLVGILDHTLTPMGARLLRKWLLRPLRELKPIQRRLDAVEALVLSPTLRENLREELGQAGDLERVATKVCVGRATPRDLMLVRLTLERIPELKRLLAEETCEALREAGSELQLCHSVLSVIRSAIVDDPPAALSDGGVIREGFNADLDELRTLARSGKEFVAQLQRKESERTAIPSLKVGFNKVFGYYLEITNAHKAKVPAEYIRKQTLVNAERYITPELKEYEEKILSAEEKIAGLEAQAFEEVRLAVAEHATVLQQNAALIAALDCLCSFAESAVKYGYSRPELTEGRDFDITEGRHPVVERLLTAGESFIPNDLHLHPESDQILVITGPNMAGKSVVLRQAGLIALMAQVGSFVSARTARIGLIDRIFTRVGASDNLAAGESTFLVEMNESANILNNATDRSLILLDEVGRGTSTFDGLSIAWSLVEYLHENESLRARTLFATHYHELNELEERLPRVRNARVQVQEHRGRVIFLRKLVEGGADHSYGIAVAQMAGLPAPMLDRAREILTHLESHRITEGAPRHREDGQSTAQAIPKLDERRAQQMSLFHVPTDPALIEIRDALASLDPDRMTPIEALMRLSELKSIISHS